jgi:hypothetical protein
MQRRDDLSTALSTYWFVREAGRWTSQWYIATKGVLLRRRYAISPASAIGR